MKTKTRLHGLLILGISTALAFLVCACYPNQPEDLGDIGLALTFDNPDGNYSGLMTWAMEDTVMALINPGDDSSEELNRIYDESILETIAAEMDKRGFQRILPVNGDLPEKPDVVIRVGAVQSDAWVGYVYWGYPGWGYPGWGWGYPSTGYYKYKQGTILWTMADWREATDPDDVTPILWVAGLNGALTGTGSGSPVTRIPNGIRQCFTQSTYIQATSR